MARKRRPYSCELPACKGEATIAPMQGRARFAWQGTPVCRTPRFHVPVPSIPAAPPKTDALLEGFCAEPHADERIALNCHGRLLLLRLADINWLETTGPGVVLHVGPETHLLGDTLEALAAKLPSDRFVLAGSSALLNVGRING
jgi:LytTr DNA-binding domain